MTVMELVDRYLATKTGVKHSTKANYKFVKNLLEKEDFSGKKIGNVKTSDAKPFLIQLQQSGRRYSTVKTVRGVLRPAFQMAVDDDCLHKNPFGFDLAGGVVNDSLTREAISRDQMRKFLKFIRDDNCYCKYYEAVFILFHTGMRISTNAGTRKLPMTEEVFRCFQAILEDREPPAVEPMVDGHVGFLYLDDQGLPLVAMHWEHRFNRMVRRYNDIFRVQMPNITPHVCRHTYCSNQARAGMNPKTLQYLMGHSDISVTMNVYTHLGLEDAAAEMARMKVVEEVRQEQEKVSGKTGSSEMTQKMFRVI